MAYVGAPRYRLHVKAPDYKLAESALKKSAQSAIKYMEQHGGEGTFLQRGMRSKILKCYSLRPVHPQGYAPVQGLHCHHKACQVLP